MLVGLLLWIRNTLQTKRNQEQRFQANIFYTGLFTIEKLLHNSSWFCKFLHCSICFSLLLSLHFFLLLLLYNFIKNDCITQESICENIFIAIFWSYLKKKSFHIEDNTNNICYFIIRIGGAHNIGRKANRFLCNNLKLSLYFYFCGVPIIQKLVNILVNCQIKMGAR